LSAWHTSIWKLFHSMCVTGNFLNGMYVNDSPPPWEPSELPARGEAEAPEQVELLLPLASAAPLPPASFSARRRGKVGALLLPGPASARQTTVPVVAGSLPARGHDLTSAASRWPPGAGLGLPTAAVGVDGELDCDFPLPPLAVSPASALRPSIFAAGESLHLALHQVLHALLVSLLNFRD
jgi:hypothetical protein